MDNFHSNLASLCVFLFNYLSQFDFLFNLQILATQCSTCFGLCCSLTHSPFLHNFASQQTQQVACRNKKKWFNERTLWWYCLESLARAANILLRQHASCYFFQWGCIDCDCCGSCRGVVQLPSGHTWFMYAWDPCPLTKTRYCSNATTRENMQFCECCIIFRVENLFWAM